MRLAVRFSVLGMVSILAAPAGAQSLTSGTWTGTLQLAGGAQVEVEFTVTERGDSLHVTMNAIDGPESPVTNLRLSGGEIAFNWGSFACSLEGKGSSYEGDCLIADRSAGELTLVPPDEAAGTGLGRDVLTREDLIRYGALNVYAGVQLLRPTWLQCRVTQHAMRGATVQFYVGGSNQPRSADDLRSLSPVDIKEVRFYGPSEATQLFGSHNVCGAVSVIL
jgi:hypothetical protein